MSMVNQISFAGEKRTYTPLRASLFWLVGTYVAFLVTGDVARVADLFKLTGFIAITTSAFAVGYVMRAKTWGLRADYTPNEPNRRRITLWTNLSSAYLGIYGLALLNVYGLANPSQIIDNILNPGNAYFYRLLDATIAPKSIVVQVLTLAAVLTTPLVPLMVLHWQKLSLTTKAGGIIGGALYCTYWLAIGTQKGLGDFVIFAGVALAVKGALSGKRVSTRNRWVIAAIAVTFAAYMVFNQSERLSSQHQIGPQAASPVVASIVGDDLARGVATTMFYPTHGYLGLSYNLDTPFLWTKGRGASRALDSYWTQYMGGHSVEQKTYPYRTEQRTGWPWDQYWATIYPWLASDLTWYGVPPFMALIGWWLAKLWLETIHLRRILSLLLLGQVALLIAYIPANNQPGITRPGLIIVITLIAAYLVSAVSNAKPARNSSGSRS